MDKLLHIVGLGGAIWNQCVEPHFEPGRIIEYRAYWRLLAIVERQEVEQNADLFQRFNIVLISAIGDR
ncbi:hypothetical protein D3C80_1910740 [compost metagenome]